MQLFAKISKHFTKNLQIQKTRCIFVSHKTGNTTNTNIMNTLQDVQRTREQFNNDLEDCLTIIQHPTTNAPYYLCEHISHALIKRTVKVFVID